MHLPQEEQQTILYDNSSNNPDTFLPGCDFLLDPTEKEEQEKKWERANFYAWKRLDLEKKNVSVMNSCVGIED